MIVLLQDLEESRQVNFEEVLEYCQQNNCPLLETSAKTGLNVTESFRLLLDRVAELKPLKFKNSVLHPFSTRQTQTPQHNKVKTHHKNCTIS